MSLSWGEQRAHSVQYTEQDRGLMGSSCQQNKLTACNT